METKAGRETRAIMERLARRGIEIPLVDISILRRAEMTLHRWSEAECGDSNEHCSWSIERDETTGKPYRVIHRQHHGVGTIQRYAVADREAGALKRVAAICARYGLQYFHQTDPRGCALYVGSEKLTDTNYSSVGIAICA